MSTAIAESYSDEAIRELRTKEEALTATLATPGGALQAAADFVAGTRCTRWVDLFYESPLSELLSGWLAMEAKQPDPNPYAVAFAQGLLTSDIELDAGHVQTLIEMERAEHGQRAAAKTIRAPKPDEVVYVIGSPGSTRVKIGRSVNVAARLRSIQNMSPAPLNILWTTPGGSELELRLHDALARYRIYGEWFDFGARNPVKLVKAEVLRLAVAR